MFKKYLGLTLAAMLILVNGEANAVKYFHLDEGRHVLLYGDLDLGAFESTATPRRACARFVFEGTGQFIFGTGEERGQLYCVDKNGKRSSELYFGIGDYPICLTPKEVFSSEWKCLRNDESGEKYRIRNAVNSSWWFYVVTPLVAKYKKWLCCF